MHSLYSADTFDKYQEASSGYTVDVVTFYMMEDLNLVKVRHINVKNIARKLK